MRPRRALPLRLLERLVRFTDADGNTHPGHRDEEGVVRPGVRSLSAGGRAFRRGKAVAHRPDGSSLTKPPLGVRKRRRRAARRIAHESRRRNA